MNDGIWNRVAPVYERAMRSQGNIYGYLYEHIGAAVAGKTVLELATGPGMIARHIAPVAASVLATDFAPKMIAEAQKGGMPPNLSFEVADATDLRFEDGSFDVVIIANALHVMPGPEKALSEIGRVLAKDGLLIAPNFVSRAAGRQNLWQKLLSLAGVKFEHAWTADEYRAFLASCGWRVCRSELVAGRIDLLYTECVRAEP